MNTERDTVVSIKCPNAERDTAKISRRIVEMMREHLQDLGGLGGQWNLYLDHKTGGGGQDRIQFKRLYDDPQSGRRVLEYLVRPGDRDTSWLCDLTPPREINPQMVEKLESKMDEPIQAIIVLAQPPTSTLSADEINAQPNQIYRATVTAHREVVMDIMVDIKQQQVPGYVELADICAGGKYDPLAMNKYPVGTATLVAIAESDKIPLRCSVQVEAKNMRHRFSDALNKDGTINLAGFSEELDLVFGLVEYLVYHAGLDLRPKPIPTHTVLILTEKFFMEKFGGKISISNSESRRLFPLYSLLKGVCGATKEPWLEKVEGGYKITDFGWAEIEAAPIGKVGKPLTMAELPDEPLTLAEQEAVLDASTEAATLANTPSSEPAGAETEVIETGANQDDQPIDLDGLAMYLAESTTRATIVRQITTLSKELDAIDEWLLENEHLKTKAELLEKLLKSDSPRGVQ